jgi:CRP-like cAMP-binding protein
VTVHGVPRPPLGVGDGFGEIALLRDLPRTATVTAGSDLATLALGRVDFLSAVTGNRVSAVAADEIATQRLSGDPDRGWDVREARDADGAGDQS